MTTRYLTRTIAGVAASLMLLGSATDSSAQLGGSGSNPKNIATGAAPQGFGGSNLGSAQLFAVLNANGTRLRGKGDASSTKLGTGIYEVRFYRNIVGCAWQGTIGFGTMSGSTAPSFISVTGRAGTVNGVFVQTWNQSGVATDLPFNVYVDC